MIVRAAAADALVHIPRGEDELAERSDRALPARSTCRPARSDRQRPRATRLPIAPHAASASVDAHGITPVVASDAA